MKQIEIKDIRAIEILDSRGNPTIEVEVEASNGICAKSKVPSGASTGSFEACELRDGDKKRYLGKGVLKAVKNVNDIISKKLVGLNILNQRLIDKTLIDLDDTPNKSNLGANAILGTSIAVCRLGAKLSNIELYKYIGGIEANILPVPMMNILNGGKHSDNNINIQEFMVMPIGDITFSERLKRGVEVYKKLKEILKKDGYVTSVGDEGGFAPNLENEEEAIKFIIKAIEESGYILKKDFVLALDVAASEMKQEAKKLGKDGYYFWKTDKYFESNEMINYLEELVSQYPIMSIEDGLFEEDWDSWKILTDKLGKKIQLVGDDLFVTNKYRLQKGIENKVANSILIKPNQIGTITETLDTIYKAKSKGYNTIISHRSGETSDTTIADIAVGVNAGQIKTGAPCRSDRVEKYNRLLEIENQLE